MHSDEERGQRFLGVPLGGSHRWPIVGETEQRVLGVPVGWFRLAGRRLDLRFARHPVRWTRWRLEVHRLGPYAPELDEMPGSHRSGRSR